MFLVLFYIVCWCKFDHIYLIILLFSLSFVNSISLFSNLLNYLVMNEQVLSYSDAKEINSIALNALHEIEKKDWSTDAFIHVIATNLKEQNNALSLSIGTVRSSDFTHRLAIRDEIFDKDFVCFKQFVLANTYSQDKPVAEDASWIWKIIVAHNQNLNQTGYERQISSIESLFAELDKVPVKARVSNLVGVADCLLKLKSSAESLKVLYRKSKEDDAAKAELIPPSIQKNAVRDILNNDLLPYMEIASKAKPEVYKATADVIFSYVESINIKVRARRTRSENQEETENLTEETNN